MRHVARLVIRPCGPEGRFEKEWKWHPDKRRLDNAVLGVAYQVVDVVNEETGAVHHEAVIYVSRRIELHVIIRDCDGYVGLLTHRREKVIPPAVTEAIFAEDPRRIPDVLVHATGITQYECPHGLAVHELEEAEEETGFAVVEAAHIGFVKESPCQGGVAHKLYATRVSDLPSGKGLEEGEQVLGITFFPPEEIRDLPTICGMTQAALWRFRSWGLSQEPGARWHETARRL